MLWPLAHENKNLILPGSSDLKQQLPTWLNRAPNADAAVCVCVVHSSAHAHGWSRACCGHDGAHTVQMPGAPSLGLRATVVRCGQSLPISWDAPTTFVFLSSLCWSTHHQKQKTMSHSLKSPYSLSSVCSWQGMPELPKETQWPYDDLHGPVVTCVSPRLGCVSTLARI